MAKIKKPGYIVSILLLFLTLGSVSAALTPIARWDVVPYQRINAEETLNLGVVAFSKEGIDRVEFYISGQGYPGLTKIANEMTLNEQTGVWEYWVPLSADEFTSDGVVTVEARVYGKDEGVRDKNWVVEGTLGQGYGLKCWTVEIRSSPTSARWEHYCNITSSGEFDEKMYYRKHLLWHKPTVDWWNGFSRTIIYADKNTIKVLVDTTYSSPNMPSYMPSEGDEFAIVDGMGLDPLVLTVNPKGTLTKSEAWVTLSGSDVTGVVNNPARPFASVITAVKAIATAQGGDAGGGVVYLGPGTYSSLVENSNKISAADEWVQIVGSGAETIIKRLNSFNCIERLKISGLVLNKSVGSGVISCGGALPGGMKVWFDDSHLIGPGRQVETSVGTAAEMVIAVHNQYYTNSSFEDLRYPTGGAMLARGVTMARIGCDAFVNVPLVVNAKVDDLGIRDVPDPGDCHPDAFQLHWDSAKRQSIGNVIAYNYRVYNSTSQSIFVADYPNDDRSFVLEGGAIVNAYVNSTHFGMWRLNTNHLVFWHNTILAPQTATYFWESIKNFSIVGSVFSKTSVLDSSMDLSGSYSNHFIAGSTYGADPSTGAASLDSKGRPLPGSKLIDRLSIKLVQTDADGKGRDAKPDVGAFEYADPAAGCTKFVDLNIASASCTTYDPVTRSCSGGTKQAYKTLAVALSAQPGDIVCVRAGTYNEQLNPSASGTAASPITFKAYPGEGCQGEYGEPKTNCQVVLSGSNARIYINRDYINVEGFKVVSPYQGYNLNIRANYVKVIDCDLDGNFAEINNYQSGGVCNNVNIGSSQYVVLENCEIHKAADDGVGLYDSSYVSLIGNVIHDLKGCGTDGGCGPCYNGHSDGIEMWSDSNINISGNLVYDVKSTAPYILGGWLPEHLSHDLSLTNNIFYSPETGFAAYFTQVDGMEVYNNVFWGINQGGGYGGLAIGQEVTNLDMYNNIILNINLIHMGATYDPVNHRSDYNLIGVDAHQFPLKSNDVVGNPQFKDILFAGAYKTNLLPINFSLQSESPAINRGVVRSGVPATDYFGNSRVGLPDIGAIEHQTSGPECFSAADCADRVCYTKACVSGQCAYTLSVGAVCNDNVDCTEDDKCDSSGACHGTPNNALCPDQPGCTGKTCTLTGCVYSGCPCKTSLATWQNEPFAEQTGSFTVTFEATPKANNIDGVVGLSDGAGTSYASFANLVRFNTNGYIDIRNAGDYNAVTSVSYNMNTKYYFRMEVDILAKTYSVYVWTAGGNEQTLAANYAFRTDQSSVTRLNNWGLIGNPGPLEICNFKLGSGCSVNADCTDQNLCTYDLCKDSVCVNNNANLDGGSTVGLGDIIQVMAHWATAGPGGDIDSNGNVGLSDIIAIIGLWANTC
ncbi:MAG: right-handed parallel beta-helix repeat-containing protein [Candidatus Altiarchaeota archaeon]|nr:right-handed parallel beta-helix repeat-containing protein [Candidatus Altiarchaeota archaeon]